MKNRNTPTLRQALKTAIADVGGVVGFLVLLAVVVGGLWWLAGVAHVQMLRYYPLHMKAMVVTASVMVPVLIVLSEVLIRTLDIAGNSMAKRQRIIAGAFYVALLLAETVTSCALLWMLAHGTPFYLWPALVVVGFFVHLGFILDKW